MKGAPLSFTLGIDSVCILKHQDGEISYKVKKSGFYWDGKLLYLSIETHATDKNAFPNCYFFAVDGFPLPNGLTSQVFQIDTNPNDNLPNVYVYTSFHAVSVSAVVQLEAITETQLQVTVKVESEDVNYYDHRAKRNTFICEAILNESPINQLWLP